MLKRFNIALTLFLFIFIVAFSESKALEEVGADSRIRTLIYGKNDVYRILTSFGYQTTIELEEDEKIKTISLGNSSSFKITPQKNRLFIRTLQGGQLTNMVVITDKRTYQFELSSILDSLDEMMYVVKFYYPDTFGDSIQGLTGGSSVPPTGTAGMYVPEVNIGVSPAAVGQFPTGAQAPLPMQQSLNFTAPNNLVFQTPKAGGALNYNYSLTGPDYLSPTEVFDDGIRTFIKFNATGLAPDFRFSTPDGKQLVPAPVNYTRQGEYYVIDGVTPKLTVFFGAEHICVYNESIKNVY